MVVSPCLLLRSSVTVTVGPLYSMRTGTYSERSYTRIRRRVYHSYTSTFFFWVDFNMGKGGLSGLAPGHCASVERTWKEAANSRPI